MLGLLSNRPRPSAPTSTPVQDAKAGLRGAKTVLVPGPVGGDGGVKCLGITEGVGKAVPFGGTDMDMTLRYLESIECPVMTGF